MSNHSQRARLSRSGGFSLIEVLVTLLILAIGLMGVAALQFRGLQFNYDAYMRSQVNILAYDISDRMRLNAANAASYVGNYTVPANTAANTCNNATGANATNDLGCWRNAVDRALPPGSTANITTANTAAGTTYTVTMSWTDRQGGAHNVTFTYVI